MGQYRRELTKPCRSRVHCVVCCSPGADAPTVPTRRPGWLRVRLTPRFCACSTKSTTTTAYCIKKMQRDSSSTHNCSSAWKSYLPQDNEIWKQISTGAPASHPLRLIQASKRRRRRNPKPRTPKTSTYGNIVYTYFPVDLYTLDAWRIDERWMKILSALVSRSSLWSALALRKPNERELRFCEKSRA